MNRKKTEKISMDSKKHFEYTLFLYITLLIYSYIFPTRIILICSTKNEADHICNQWEMTISTFLLMSK